MKDKERDQADQELIKQQRADQAKDEDGKVKPMGKDVRIPEPKR